MVSHDGDERQRQQHDSSSGVVCFPSRRALSALVCALECPRSVKPSVSMSVGHSTKRVAACTRACLAWHVRMACDAMRVQQDRDW